MPGSSDFTVKYFYVLTRARCGGGGGRFGPPCRIFSIAKKRRQILTRNFPYLLQHQFTSTIKISEKSDEFFSENDVLLLHVSPFQVKNCKCLKAAIMQVEFKVMRNKKALKGLKLNALIIDYLRFLCIQFLRKNSKFCFFVLKISYKIENFQVVQKTEYMISRQMQISSMHIGQFQSNIFVFGCAIAQKLGN